MTDYKSKKPIGVYPTCNFGGLVILDIIHDIDDSAVAAWHFGEKYEAIRQHKIYTTATGRSYIRKGGRRFYFDEIMRAAT